MGRRHIERGRSVGFGCRKESEDVGSLVFAVVVAVAALLFRLDGGFCIFCLFFFG